MSAPVRGMANNRCTVEPRCWAPATASWRETDAGT